MILVLSILLLSFHMFSICLSLAQGHDNEAHEKDRTQYRNFGLYFIVKNRNLLSLI